MNTASTYSISLHPIIYLYVSAYLQRNMNPHKTLLIPLLMAVLAVAFGYRSYDETRTRIANDLSQAVRQTVMNERRIAQQPAPVTVSGNYPAFAQALTIEALRERAVLTVSVLSDDKARTPAEDIPADCLPSDTVLWLTPEADGLALSFRAYARCTPWFILTQSDQTLSLLLLAIALLCGAGLSLHRRPQHSNTTDAPEDNSNGRLITLGNLSLSTRDDCFYNDHRERLHLTPMQHALMEMFYLNDAHRLTKPHICRALWPGKDNADETLYTLIRRLKPILEAHSNLRISSDRGRAYVLEVCE